LNFNPSAFRYAVSKTRPDQPSKQLGNVAYDINDFRYRSISYEVDVWGKIRRLTEAAGAQAKANLAAYYTVLLTLEGRSRNVLPHSSQRRGSAVSCARTSRFANAPETSSPRAQRAVCPASRSRAGADRTVVYPGRRASRRQRRTELE